jgi:hypothetical protein
VSSEPEEEVKQLTTLMQEYSDTFDQLCQKRHVDGAAEYGQFTFIGNDVVRMMAEELADTANYCRMQFIKLMMLQDMLVDQLGDKPFNTPTGEVTIGSQSFKGTKKGWKE